MSIRTVVRLLGSVTSYLVDLRYGRPRVFVALVCAVVAAAATATVVLSGGVALLSPHAPAPVSEVAVPAGAALHVGAVVAPDPNPDVRTRTGDPVVDARACVAVVENLVTIGEAHPDRKSLPEPVLRRAGVLSMSAGQVCTGRHAAAAAAAVGAWERGQGPVRAPQWPTGAGSTR